VAIGSAVAPFALGQAPRNPCPSAFRHGSPPAPSHLRALRQGNFKVLGRSVRLVPPVNWNQNPAGSEVFQRKLQAMNWLEPLLAQYSMRRDRAALRQAAGLMLDWVRANPRQSGSSRGGARRFAWRDKITGERAVFLGYVAAAASCSGIVAPNQQAVLVRSATEHMRFLADPANYDPGKKGNHGLSQDLGLLELTGYLPSLPGAAAARALAAKRFRENLPIHPHEAVDLEHSPNYHFNVYGLIRDVLRLPGQRDPALMAIAARMRAVAGWFVMPNRRVTRLGDTPVRSAPGWAAARARGLRGFAPTARSGFGIVRAGGGYLSVAAGYHPYGHKQADELTFELYDRGRQIVTDSGRYGAARNRADPVKARAQAFVAKSQAHSGLVVDDVSYRVSGYEPYGSAIEALGTGAGWYAIQASNPLVAKQGVKHTRWFLYRPGQALVVVDRVNSSGSHTYTRYFQFDPAISVRPAGSILRLAAPRFSGSLHDAPGHGQTGRSVVRGRRGALTGYTSSPLLGFTSSPNTLAPLVARTAVVLRSRGASLAHAAVISVGGPASVALVRQSGDSVTVRLSRGGRAPVTVTATRSGDRITVTAG
jgi:hypothetical protein